MLKKKNLWKPRCISTARQKKDTSSPQLSNKEPNCESVAGEDCYGSIISYPNSNGVMHQTKLPYDPSKHKEENTNPDPTSSIVLRNKVFFPFT